MFDFFYGLETRQYAFYSVPQLLFTDDKFKDISCEAKLLYGFLLDRTGLSQKNGWHDADGKVFVFFKLDELCEKLNIGTQKAVKVFNELDSEKGIGLIKRKKQGQGKPTKIYVMNFTKYIDSESKSLENADNIENITDKFQTCENQKSETETSQVLNCENHKSGVMNITSQDFGKSPVHIISNTENIILSESYQSNQSETPERHKSESQKSDKIDRLIDLQTEREEYLELLKENIEWDWWTDSAKADWKIKSKMPMVEELLSVMLDVVCSHKPTIRISGEEKPTAVVKSVFLKLGQEHIEYVINSLEKATNEIKNPRAYMITALYNAWATYNYATQADVNRLINRDFP